MLQRFRLQRSRRPAVFAAIAVISLVVAACSGGGSSDTSSDSGGNTAVQQPGSRLALGLIDTPKLDGQKVGTRIDQLAPNFRLPSSDRGDLALSDLRGKPVFLNFWATWCGPCRFEMPEIQALFEEMGDQITILAVDLDESEKEVNAFKEDLGLTFTTAIDDGQKVFDRYAPFGLPSTYLIDADGFIRAVKFGPFVNRDDIGNSLEKLGL